VTRPRVFDPPSALSEAVDQVDVWLASPSVILLAEADDYWRHLKQALLASRTIGAKVHDARIAAICLQHGVRELWSTDRDFSRFPQLKTVNPLVR
jgi:predicted nucleic acid-binding protein